MRERRLPAARQLVVSVLAVTSVAATVVGCASSRQSPARAAYEQHVEEEAAYRASATAHWQRQLNGVWRVNTDETQRVRDRQSSAAAHQAGRYVADGTWTFEGDSLQRGTRDTESWTLLAARPDMLELMVEDTEYIRLFFYRPDILVVFDMAGVPTVLDRPGAVFPVEEPKPASGDKPLPELPPRPSHLRSTSDASASPSGGPPARPSILRAPTAAASTTALVKPTGATGAIADVAAAERYLVGTWMARGEEDLPIELARHFRALRATFYKDHSCVFDWFVGEGSDQMPCEWSVAGIESDGLEVLLRAYEETVSVHVRIDSPTALVLSVDDEEIRFHRD